VHFCNVSLRLDVIGGTVLTGPVLLEPSLPLERLNGQLGEIRKLHAILKNFSPSSENDPRLSRLAQALQALDARAQGASLRDLAVDILRVNDWPGDGECVKSRARRLVALAKNLQLAGPRGVLAREV
jgi:hypothetical protein